MVTRLMLSVPENLNLKPYSYTEQAGNQWNLCMSKDCVILFIAIYIFVF